MRRFLGLVSAAALASTALAPATAMAAPVSRDEVLTRAFAYAAHPWTSTTANQTATCSAKYRSLDPPGDYVGVAYDWGGYMTLFEYDRQILAGYGAGSQETDGILACTAGVDCSGFVSKTWDTGHNTTTSIPNISGVITRAELLPGDVFNKSGYHVAMFTRSLANGEPAMVEAIGYNVHTNVTGGFSHVVGYIPRRYGQITGTTLSAPVGTPTAPIKIGAFPYTDARDTSASNSSALGGCVLAPNTSEAGPEYVYEATFTEPGTLTVTVSSNAGADIDVELFAPLNSNTCHARGDTTFTKTVGCGTYYIVADTFGSDANAGAYTLNATFAPSGQACGAVPGPTFNPQGKLGDPCGYPGNEDLPYCNQNFGAETCVYDKSSSYCSIACEKDAECTGMPGGGCCQDLTGKGERYCVAAAKCPPGRASSGGTSGTSGSSGESGGEETPVEEEGVPNAAAPGASTTTKTEGCSATSGARPSDFGALAIASLGAVAMIRRRRASPATPTARRRG